MLTVLPVSLLQDDPLTAFMQEHGVPMEDCVMNPSTTAVFRCVLFSASLVWDS
jgi:hypothetical protein